MNIKTANRLCELRKKHGLSQEDLAYKLGVSRQAISKWERSESSPDTDNLIELANLYGISLDELLNGDDAIDIIEENKESDKENKEDTTEVDDDLLIDDGEGNEIRHSREGLVLTDDEGNVVRISKGKVVVKDSNGETKIISKEDWKNSKHHKAKAISGSITGAFALMVVIAYILLGFFNPFGYGFAHYWFLFILIPVPGSFVSAIMKRDPHEFLYPLVVTAVFCALGMFMGMWHPLWVLFITIPVYYIVTEPLKKKRKIYNKD